MIGDKKKIIIVGTLTDEMNGSAKSFVRLVNILSNKYDIIAVVPDLNGVVRQIDKDNVIVINKNIQPIRRSFNLYGIIRSIYYFICIIKRYKPDLVHINDIPWFYLVIIAKLYKNKVTIHSRFIENNIFVKSVIKQVISRCNAIIFVSNYNKKLWGIKNDKICHVINNPGVELYASKENSKYDKYFLVVSRISNEKGIINSVRLYLSIYKYFNDYKLIIIGDAIYEYQKEYKKKCDEFIKSNKIQEQVMWLGKKNDLYEYYKNTTAFIHLPEFEDPFPTTVMEALYVGCKIIVNKKGGIVEQVDSFNGVLFVDEKKINNEKVRDFIIETPLYIDRKKEYMKKYGEKEFEVNVRKVFDEYI